MSSIGDSKALQGGTLLMTPLKGADGQVYAVGQGPVSTGGFTVGANTGDKVQKNFTTVGRIVQGAVVEREIPFNLNQKDTLTLALHQPDFTTATRMAEAINAGLLENAAFPQDSGTVQIAVPPKYLGGAVAEPLPAENFTLFTRAGGTPRAGNRWQHERVLDAAGALKGYLSYNTS